MQFIDVKKSQKRSGFVICSNEKDSAFVAVKTGCASVYNRYVKRVPLVTSYTKGVPFMSRMVEFSFFLKKSYKPKINCR